MKTFARFVFGLGLGILLALLFVAAIISGCATSQPIETSFERCMRVLASNTTESYARIRMAEFCTKEQMK